MTELIKRTLLTGLALGGTSRYTEALIENDGFLAEWTWLALIVFSVGFLWASA